MGGKSWVNKPHYLGNNLGVNKQQYMLFLLLYVIFYKVKIDKYIILINIKKMDFETLIGIGYLILAIFQIWVYKNLKSY